MYRCSPWKLTVFLLYNEIWGVPKPEPLEPPFWVMKMNISRGKTYRNPPLEIPRDEIFVFEEEQKKIAYCIAGYNILRVHKLEGSYEPPVYRSLQCRNQQLSQPPILIVLFSLLRYNNIQLSPEGEVNSGGYIPRREASRYISTALHRPWGG